MVKSLYLRACLCHLPFSIRLRACVDISGTGVSDGRRKVCPVSRWDRCVKGAWMESCLSGAAGGRVIHGNAGRVVSSSCPPRETSRACAVRALGLGCDCVFCLDVSPVVCEKQTGVGCSAEESWQLSAFQWSRGPDTIVASPPSVSVPLHTGGDIWKDLYRLPLLSSCEGPGHWG